MMIRRQNKQVNIYNIYIYYVCILLSGSALVLRILVPPAHLSGPFSDHHLRPACTDAYDCPSMYVPLNTAGIPSHESPLVVFQGPRRLVAILDECVLRYMKVAGHARGMILQSMECLRDHADTRASLAILDE